MKKSLSILLLTALPLSAFAGKYNNVKIGTKRYDHTAVKAQNRARVAERAALMQQQAAAAATRTIVPVTAVQTGQETIATPSGDVYFMYCNGKKISFSGGQVPQCPSENTVFIQGCTDNRALNYNPDAKQNDGTCKYPVAEVAPTLPQVGIQPVDQVPTIQPVVGETKPIAIPSTPQILPVKPMQPALPVKPVAIAPAPVKPVKPIAYEPAPVKPIVKPIAYEPAPVRPVAVDVLPTKPVYVKPVKPVFVKPIKPALVAGCKDKMAVNYNFKATVHDRNACVYGKPALVKAPVKQFAPAKPVYGKPSAPIREPASFQQADQVRGIEF